MRSSPVKILLTTVAIAAALAACQRRDDKAKPAQPAPAPAAATVDGPLAYDAKTPYATVKLTLPEGVKTAPGLRGALYDAGVRELGQFAEGAQADLSEAGGGNRPYERTVTYSPGGETPRLISVARTNFEDTGGAHPNVTYGGVIWDKTAKRPLGFADLFRAGPDTSALDKALCAAANAAKQARSPGSEPATLGGKMWTCPKASATPFILTPGSEPGKIGGITFLLDSYQIGPHSDGDYWIALPQSAFRTLLAPAYADQFGGAPVKAGDVTPTNG